MTAKILGRRQRADGTDKEEVKARLAIARTRLTKLRPIWRSTEFTGKQKVMIYRSVIISALTYGCESWELTDGITKSLDRFNKYWYDKTVMSQVPAGEKVHFDLVAHVHLTRLHWLGHVWRMELSSDEPRAPFRVMLTEIRSTSPVRPRHQAQNLGSLRDDDFGADPKRVDFDIDKDATFRKGSLFELIPPADTFVELEAFFRDPGDEADGDATAKDIRREWRKTAKALVARAFPED